MDIAGDSFGNAVSLLKGSRTAFDKLISYIGAHYVMEEMWKEGKPKSNYRNELKYRRGGKTLVTIYIREDFFKVCVVLGRAEREKFEQARDTFSECMKRIYDGTETLHDGKWLGVDVRDETPVDDIIRLLQLKRKPML